MTDPVQTPLPKASFYGWKNAWILFIIYMVTTGLVYSPSPEYLAACCKDE